MKQIREAPMIYLPMCQPKFGTIPSTHLRRVAHRSCLPLLHQENVPGRMVESQYFSYALPDFAEIWQPIALRIHEKCLITPEPEATAAAAINYDMPCLKHMSAA